jgi:hypothetical protein
MRRNFGKVDEENLQLQYPSEVLAYQFIITKCFPTKVEPASGGI